MVSTSLSSLINVDEHDPSSLINVVGGGVRRFMDTVAGAHADQTTQT